MKINEELKEGLDKTYAYRLEVYNQIKDSTDNQATKMIAKTGGLEKFQNNWREQEGKVLDDFAEVADTYSDFIKMARGFANNQPTLSEVKAGLKGIKINKRLLRNLTRRANTNNSKVKHEFIDVFEEVWNDNHKD